MDRGGSRGARWLATLALYAFALAIVAGVGYSAATQQNAGARAAALLVAFLAFAIVGTLVASRQPRNAVGWIFIGRRVSSSGCHVVGGE